jgi:hypothetical protein
MKHLAMQRMDRRLRGFCPISRLGYWKNLIPDISYCKNYKLQGPSAAETTIYEARRDYVAKQTEQLLVFNQLRTIIVLYVLINLSLDSD